MDIFSHLVFGNVLCPQGFRHRCSSLTGCRRTGHRAPWPDVRAGGLWVAPRACALSRPGARATVGSFSRNSAGKTPSAFRMPAGPAAARCSAAITTLGNAAGCLPEGEDSLCQVYCGNGSAKRCLRGSLLVDYERTLAHVALRKEALGKVVAGEPPGRRGRV